ncbi:MAG TPA: AAA family ATPase [Alphaproteobacteria bacterium]|jgi:predicted ATPase|nr:AAA family ATPase [Alphaproteobacteria bacterium]
MAGAGLRSKNYLLEAILLRGTVPDFDAYPFSVPAIRAFDKLKFEKPVTFLIGENGSGKSTLMEAIATAWGFNPEGGSRNFGFSTRASHSNLNEFLRLSRGVRRAGDGFFLRAESYFNLATNIEELDKEPQGGPPIITYYGGKSLHEQSHGESFITLVTKRFNGHGFYILDEPEAALSPTRQLTLLSLMHNLVKDGAQFLIATHSPILMAYPDAAIFQMSDDGPFEIPYRETEHYAITKRFLDQPEEMLEVLLNPDLYGD